MTRLLFILILFVVVIVIVFHCYFWNVFVLIVSFRFVLLRRIKELIVTAGGENVAPVPIENYLKNAIGDAVSNIVLIGDKRKFLSVLTTLKVKQDADKEFTNELAGDAIDVSPNCKSVDQAKNDATWKNLIENGIKKYNRDAKVCVCLFFCFCLSFVLLDSGNV